jgi:hypothetical protein
MSKIGDFYTKHKDALLIGVGIIAIGGVGTGIYQVAHHQPVIAIKDTLPVDESHVLADNILLFNEAGDVKLIGINDGKEMNSTSLKQVDVTHFIYSNAKDFKKLYAYGSTEKKIFEITVADSKVSSKTLVDLKDNTVEISNFKVEGDNVYFVSADGKSVNKVSVKDGSIKNVPLKEAVENWVVTGDYFVYSTPTKLYSVNTADGSSNQIEIGDKTTGLFFANGQVVDFNKFGSGKNTSIMLQINPSDLAIKNMIKFDTANVNGLTNDSEDKSIYVGQLINGTDNKPVQSIGNIDLDKSAKGSIDIPTSKDTTTFTYNQSNTITAKGYIYSLVDKNIEVVDTVSKQVVRTVAIDGQVFMPVMK